MKATNIISLTLLWVVAACSSQQSKESAASRVESVTPEEFNTYLQDEELQLIDVRTPREFATGYIDGAVNMDVTSKNFSVQIETLNKDKAVAIYCASGGRSKRAASRLEAFGFTKIIELNTGINGWSAAQFPLKRP
ncbi:rhodanese-like domain-containing protein [Marinoscillum furvescens]|uniref:Rhodanese-related sulfurtransferase n=1 Tax=Marinoscillum furvescens DSM 4134 TaxID=1122208 RepID=A0A3D9L726_MARFU|nr:rhodanese-like domain-containing protein [Marinoscillum furvescens]REE02115.1 rhodanese-related sulfurtransferase [Marinoscillum furvescens DSM 4134]